MQFTLINFKLIRVKELNFLKSYVAWKILLNGIVDMIKYNNIFFAPLN